MATSADGMRRDMRTARSLRNMGAVWLRAPGWKRLVAVLAACCLGAVLVLGGCACSDEGAQGEGAGRNLETSEGAEGDAAVEAPSARDGSASGELDSDAEPGSDAEAEGSAAADEAAATPSTAGALQVVGSQLCAADGSPVQLRGVSTHGLAWFPQYVNGDFFQELRRDWDANAVRLAMYTAESGGYCADGDQAALRQLVIDGVDYATAADLYVIVDWHVLSDQNPLAHADEAEAFFADMSARLADRDNVIYEICNEPNGSATWGDVKSYANRIIPAIRANDPDAVVIVGTPEWSQRVDQAVADPLDADNVLYALHFYAATHQQDLRDRMAAVVDAGLPVFVSEFGICDASGNGAVDYQSADAWVSLMDELGVSFVCWNLSNKNETSALFRPDCAKTSGFAEDDLSDEGRWLREVLRGQRPEGDDTGAGAGAGAAASNGGGMASGSGSSSGSGSGQGAVAAVGAAGPGSLGSTLTGSSNGISWSATVRQTWESEGVPVYLYDVTVTNDGPSAANSWSIAIPFETPIALSDSWNGAFAVDGATLTIANVDYNGMLAPGASASDVGFIVTAA